MSKIGAFEKIGILQAEMRHPTGGNRTFDLTVVNQNHKLRVGAKWANKRAIARGDGLFAAVAGRARLPFLQKPKLLSRFILGNVHDGILAALRVTVDGFELKFRT